MQTCSNISWGIIPQRHNDTLYTATLYKGNVCKAQLSRWQKCVLNSSTVIHICNQSSETERETEAKDFKEKIGKI